MSKAGKKRKTPGSGLPDLAKALVAEPEAKANNLPVLLAALKPGCAEVRSRVAMHAARQRRRRSRRRRLQEELARSLATSPTPHPHPPIGHAGAAPPALLLHRRV